MKKAVANENMANLQSALAMFLEGQAATFHFVMEERYIKERAERAYHALKGLGYSTLFSHTMRVVSMGNNAEKKGLGFSLYYHSGRVELKGLAGHAFIFDDFDDPKVREHLRVGAAIMNGRPL